MECSTSSGLPQWVSKSIESCDGKTLLTGDNRTVIKGFGYAYLWVTRACGKREKIKISAPYIPGFHTNPRAENELAIELQGHHDFLVANVTQMIARKVKVS
jgi:hypothetical protein